MMLQYCGNVSHRAQEKHQWLPVVVAIMCYHASPYKKQLNTKSQAQVVLGGGILLKNM